MRVVDDSLASPHRVWGSSYFRGGVARASSQKTRHARCRRRYAGGAIIANQVKTLTDVSMIVIALRWEPTVPAGAGNLRPLRRQRRWRRRDDQH